MCQNNQNKNFSLNSSFISSGVTNSFGLVESIEKLEHHHLTKDEYIIFLKLINAKQPNEEKSTNANMTHICLSKAFNFTCSYFW